jgi:hypothetical protein
VRLVIAIDVRCRPRWNTASRALVVECGLRMRDKARVTLGQYVTRPTDKNALMRIWDVPPRQLCRQHLLGEHRELHGLWNILVVHGGTGGYSRHPETMRWVGKTRALFERHQLLVKEMERRGYRHLSPLDESAAAGARVQDILLDSLEEQRRMLGAKQCDCPLSDV